MSRPYTCLQSCALTVFLIATFGLSALAQKHPPAAPKTAAHSKSSPAPAQPHPSLSYATYLLNSGDRINALAKGVDGSVYAAGVTVPAAVAADVTQPSAGAGNAFVAHFSADGKKLLYFSYLDNSGLDEARAIAVDANGYAYVTGETKSPAFPVVSAIQASCKTGSSGACAGNAFVAKLDPSGKVVLASYLGGSGEDGGNAIAVDSKGNIYVAGSATSLDFPVTSALQSTAAGKGDAFVAAIAADGSHVLYATYLGGSEADEARGIAVDAQGNAYVTGVTLSLDFPTSSALQAKCAANAKSACAGTAFVSKLSADGSRLAYSTYLGGSGGDSGNAIAVDKNGNAYVAGLTNSSDFPVAKGSQSALAGSSNAFVSKLSADGSTLAFSTYLGGKVSDQANAIAVDGNGNVFVAGWTHSPDFPVKNPVQASCRVDAKHACTVDAFAAQLSASGAKLQFSTFLGGSGMDSSRGLAVDTQGSVYLGGWTTSRDFPQAQTVLAPGAASSTNLKASSTKATTASSAATATTSGGSFVAKISGVTAPATTVTCGSGTKNWTGSGNDGQWTTATNWTSNTLPVSTDNVCIDSTFSATTISINTISATANQTIASLNSGAPILFQSGPLTITGTSSFYDLNMAGGVLTLSGSSTMATLEAGGGYLTGAGSITVSGLLTWASGYLCTTYTTTNGCAAPTTQAVTNASGGISFTSSGTLDGRTLNTASGQTFSYTGANYLYLYDGAIVNNVSGSTWDLGNDANVYSSPMGSAGGVFNNAGTLTKSSGTGTSSFYPALNNTGTVNLTAATTDFSGGGDCGSACAGTWSVATGATLQLDTGTFALSGGISGAGTVDFNGGTENLTGSYNITGATTVSGGTANFNGSLTSVGPLAVSGGVANFSTASPVTVTTATLNLSGGYLTGSDNVTVTGLLTWSNGYMCTTYVINSGCTAPSTQAVTKANGGISFTGYGQLDGRTLNTVTGKSVTYSTTNQYFYLYDGAIVNNVSGSTWDLGNDANVYSSPMGSAGGVFNNAGTLKKSSGAGTSSFYPALNNTGTVTLSAATTDFSGGSSGAGTWSVGTGAMVQFDTGTFSLGAISGAGTVDFNGGTETLNGAYTLTGPANISNAAVDFAQSSPVTVAGPLNLLSGGYMYGPATVSIGGLLTWSGGSICTTYASGTCTAPTTPAVINANGGITITGYGSLDGRTLNTASGKSVTYSTNISPYVYLYDGAVVNNVAGSTWSLANDGNVYSSPIGSSGGTFNNAGTLIKSSTTTGTSYIYPQFNNTGSVQANAGNLYFDGGFSQTAGTTSMGGGGISFANPTTIQGGAFGGSGTVSGGALTNTGATLAPGTSTTAGSMTITGGYSQTSPGAMSIKVGGTTAGSYDTVAVGNSVTLGGPLSITLINGFTPTVGTGFTILTTSSTSTISGTFSSVSSGWSVTYNPTSVVVTYQGGGGAAPVVKLSATKLTFPTTIINTAKALTLKVTNTGTAALSISNIAISGTNATEYTYKTTTCTAVVNPGAYCTISVTFKPTDKGTRTATLTLTDNASPSTQSVPLTGVGTYVQVTPSPVAFPSQLLNTTSAPMSITVKNVSTVNTVTVTSITLAGTKAAEYTLSGTGNCTSLLPNTTCTLTMTFTPTALGSQAVTLEIFDDGGGSPQKVPVSGKGTYVTLSPSPLVFGSVTVGTSTSQTVTVTNTGPSTTITVKSVAFIGTNKADFKAALGSTCSSVAPNGGTCTITVTFKPAAKGARSATMNVTDTDLGSPQSDAVSGTGQ